MPVPVSAPAKTKKIRVMVVDDSIVARNLLITGLSAHPLIEVVGYAINALDAKNKLPRLKPDVMTLAVEMPGESGLDLLKELLPTHPIPVILVSSLNLRVFDALAAGAVDFVRKPEANQSRDAFLATLAQKIVVAAHARVHPAPAGVRQPQPTGPLPTIPLLGRPKLDRMVIGLGASTGGTEAALKVLRQLPADIPGMVLVQHMPAGFTKMYADRLNKLCQMQVREAKDGDKVERGTVLVAPADLQIRMQRDGAGNYTVSCKPGEKVSGHRPSVDSLFLSMAQVVRHQMVGIIMTGMGRDGADGLLAMRKQGAFTIGQDRESSVVYGMPMVAYDIGAVQVQASCDNIASVLLRHLQTM